MLWTLTDTQGGYPTIKLNIEKKSLYLHSKYDPIEEANRWVKGLEFYEIEEVNNFIVVGMGAGYHVKALSQAYPNAKIYVWDFNLDYVSWIKTTGLLDWMQKNEGKVFYQASECIEEIKRTFLPIIVEKNSVLLIHPPSLQLIPEKLKDLQIALERHLLFYRSLRAQRNLLDHNYNLNMQLGDPGISKWVNYYVSRPMILVSAGPSLTKQLPLLQDVKGKHGLIIGSVGTALNPLLKKNIVPDFVVVTDAKAGIGEQLCVASSYNNIPLFYLCTANADAISNYTGPRYIMWQKGFQEAEYRSQHRCEPLIQSGGSVATCLLDLMVLMGGNPIALVGQDLAYTGGHSHASDTHAKRRISNTKTVYEVVNFYNNGTVATSLGLLSFLKWFESYVSDKEDPNRFWNCTEGGAFLNGWKHSTFKNFIDTIK